MAKRGPRGHNNSFSYSAKCCTKEVACLHCPKATPGVSIKLFDSPGPQDCTGKEDDYIQELKEKCGEVNLALFCHKMTNLRLTDDDKHALKKLKVAFGNEFGNSLYSFLCLLTRKTHHKEMKIVLRMSLVNLMTKLGMSWKGKDLPIVSTYKGRMTKSS